MKYLWLLIVLTACPAAEASKLAAPRGLDLFVQTAGDTARGVFHWTAVTGATSYKFTVTASLGTWRWVMETRPGTLTGAFTAVNSVVDSADFVVCVRGYNATDSSAAGCSVPRRYRRPLGPAPLVIWDSLKVASVQVTGAWCASWTDSLNVWPYDELGCVPLAWHPEKRQLLAKDRAGCVRSCPIVWSVKADPKGRWCDWALVDCWRV